MKLYKLTTQDFKTRQGEYNETTWGDGIKHTTSGNGDLCGPGWLHAYEDPLVAAFMNPAHANIHDPVLWECDGDVGKREGERKCGCTRLQTLQQIPMPTITRDQRIEVAIRIARGVMKQLNIGIKAWDNWADKWLNGSERSVNAAYADAAAADAADAAYAYADADAAAADAAYAAKAAAHAADAAYADADAADAAKAAADAAVNAAKAAAYAAKAAADVSLISILHQVVDGEVTR